MFLRKKNLLGIELNRIRAYNEHINMIAQDQI